MKNLLLCAILALCGTCLATAQVDKDDNPNEEALDKLQQEPPRPSERATETQATRAAATQERESKAASQPAQKPRTKQSGKTPSQTAKSK